MVTKEELLYRQVFTLKDGARILIRPMTKDDLKALQELFLPVTPEERRFMRHDVNNPEVIASWIENLDYDKVFPLVALVGDRIVGEATLHFYVTDPSARHRAEIRIFLSKDFRQRGLGTKLLLALTEIAKKRSLYFLEVQVVRDLTNDVKAMERLGFKIECIFEDYFMLPDGELRDVVHMIMRLREPIGEF